MKMKKWLLIFVLILFSIYVVQFFLQKSSPEFTGKNLDCVSNPNPVFTHDVADISRVKMIVPPGSVETFQGGKVVKAHAYVLVDDGAPVYAPADGILIEGAHYTEDDESNYYLLFQTSCEIVYRFDHIADPIKELRDALPQEPAKTTHTTSPKKNVEVHAGQLIGYAHQTPMAYRGTWFDFGVANTTQTKDLKSLEKQGVSLDERDYQSICPYDFFPEDMRNKYYSFFDNYKDDGVVPTLYCK
jgi:hypothetical protein